MSLNFNVDLSFSKLNLIQEIVEAMGTDARIVTQKELPAFKKWVCKNANKFDVVAMLCEVWETLHRPYIEKMLEHHPQQHPLFKETVLETEKKDFIDTQMKGLNQL